MSCSLKKEDLWKIMTRLKSSMGPVEQRGLLTFPNESPGFLKVQCVRSFVEVKKMY